MSTHTAWAGRAFDVLPDLEFDPRDILDGSVPIEQATIPEAGRYRASTKSAGDPAAAESLT